MIGRTACGQLTPSSIAVDNPVGAIDHLARRADRERFPLQAEGRSVLDWLPILMSAETAARYLDMCESSFRRGAAKAIPCVPAGIGDARWRRCDLEAWVNGLVPTVHDATAEDAANDNFAAEAALARVRAGTRGRR